MYLGKNIRYLRKRDNLSQEDLAEKLGYRSFTTIQKWESEVAEPKFKTLKRMADLFHVDMKTLTETDIEEGTPEIDENQGVKIPVVGRVAAGLPLIAEENIIDYEEIPRKLANLGDYFGLRIKGDSMTPSLCDGDIVIIRRQADADPGDFVIAMVNGYDAVCKKLAKYDSGNIALISLNPNYEPMIFSQKDIKSLPVNILGKVVELRRKL